MPAVVIVLILIESLLLLISNIVQIPEYTSIIVGCLLAFAIWIFWRREGNVLVKRLLTALSVMAICWSLYSAYALPYWNSITFLDITGRDYPISKELDEVLSPEEARQDYLFAMKQLKKVHPAFLDKVDSSRFGPSIEWADSISVCRLYQRLQSTVSSLHDAHTKVFPVLRKPRVADYSAFGDIISINGVRREDFVDSFGDYISSETREWTTYCILSRLNSLEDLKLYGLFDCDSVRIGFSSSERGQFSHTFKEKDFQFSGQSSSYSLSSAHQGGYSFNDTVSCGYLRLDNLINYTPAARRRFKKSIDSFFSQLIQRDYQHLIIDLRGNRGGNVEISRILFRYLPVDEIKMGARYYRCGPFLFGSSVRQVNRSKKEHRFDGDIYVLTSLTTFSAAMHLADYLQGNGLAKIVGQSPGNTPTCYTNIAHFVLPNSHLSLNVSTGKFMRTDETQEENIIKPDLPCEAKIAYTILMQQFMNADRHEH